MAEKKEQEIRVCLGKEVIDRGQPYHHEVYVDFHSEHGALYFHEPCGENGVYLYREQVEKLRAFLKTIEDGIEIIQEV